MNERPCWFSGCDRTARWGERPGAPTRCDEHKMHHTLILTEWWEELKNRLTESGSRSDPIELLLWCPSCSARHIDEGEFATKVHHTHACQSCGMVWRPAIEPTRGVRFLKGFKNTSGETL